MDRPNVPAQATSREVTKNPPDVESITVGVQDLKTIPRRPVCQPSQPSEGINRSATAPTAPSRTPSMPLVQSPTSLSTMSTMSSTSSQTQAQQPQEKSIWLKGFEEARHFAGGLITHPSESTKHYTLLRHSHGLVYYQGPATSLAITAFSTHPLPRDRKLYIQKKGWLGKTGWSARALLGANADWVDVTPERSISAAAAPPNDNRAWERDIRKFLKRAAREKAIKDHAVRETFVVRIPETEDLGDGYFRLVLCQGSSKKILCASPVFRVASISTSAASFKGASLASLPLELAVSVGSSLATSQVGAWTSAVAAPVQAVYAQYQPGAVVQDVAATSYEKKVAPRLEGLNERVEVVRQGTFQTVQQSVVDDKAATSVAKGTVEKSLEEATPPGPLPPYPLRMESKIVKGTGHSTAHLGTPTANLASIPQDLRYRLSGVYFGWGRFTPPKDTPPQRPQTAQPHPNPKTPETWTSWHAAIITVAPPPNAPSVAPTKQARAHLLHTSPPHANAASSITLLVTGFLRPLADPETHGLPCTPAQLQTDISAVLTRLAQPGWSAAEAEARLEKAAEQGKNGGVAEQYVKVRQKGLEVVDRVPLHRVGVRTETARLRGGLEGRGGFAVMREGVGGMVTV